MINNQNNKALWIFQNIKDSVDTIPERYRGNAWKLIIDYAFGSEIDERKITNKQTLLTFRAIKPLIRLRGIAGSQNGKSNNPSGLAKIEQPNIGANIGANIEANPLITETETETETITKTKTGTKSIRP